MSSPGHPSPARTALGAAVVVSGLVAAGRGVWVAGAARRFAGVRGPRSGSSAAARARAVPAAPKARA